MHRIAAGLIWRPSLAATTRRHRPQRRRRTTLPLGFAVDGQKGEGGPLLRSAAQPGNVQRKVIKATLDVLVRFLTMPACNSWLIEHKGYIAKSDFQGVDGKRRRPRCAVPAETFQAFVDATAGLAAGFGTLQADDVTEEFVDEAMVKNLGKKNSRE